VPFGPTHLVYESVWAAVVVGKRLVHHQEHYAGQEGQGQDYEDSDLRMRDYTPFNLIAAGEVRFPVKAEDLKHLKARFCYLIDSMEFDTIISVYVQKSTQTTTTIICLVTR
jgi:hypothetical protein